MNATIITIGDELLIGQVVDTNSAWLAAELTAIGFRVVNTLSISDNGEAIRTALDRYMPENDLLLITGGLGPTNDDITRKILADYFGSGMRFSEEVLSDVESFISGIGSYMNEHNRKQALVPEAAVVLRNQHGTAPGLWFEKDNHTAVSLPGVPHEMKGIFNDELRTKIIGRFKLPDIVYKTVMFTGIGEAPLAEKLTGWEDSLPRGISVAYLPSPGIIRLRLGATGEDRSAIEKVIEQQVETLKQIVSKYIYGYDDEKLEEVVGRMLLERGAALATAESCTGGLIASRITSIAGCSAWFRGSVVAYSNEVKKELLGVKPETLMKYGAVSEETVKQMAAGVMRAAGSDYAVATSGIAGPDGGTPEKPVGTVWIAAAGPGFTTAKKFSFGQVREMNILRSSIAAMNLLRKSMLEE